MPAGFQSINDSGTVQIDENFSSLMLISKTTVSITATRAAPYDVGRWGTYTVTANDPVVLLGPTSGNYVNIVSRVFASGQWTYTFCTNNTGHSQTIYVFDKNIATGSNFGMQVFSSTGALVYDSNVPYLRISNILQCSTADTSAFSIPQDGRSYAAALTYPRSSIIATPPIPFIFQVLRYECIAVSTTGINTSVDGQFYKFPSDNGSRAVTTAFAPQVILADVTYM